MSESLGSGVSVRAASLWATFVVQAVMALALFSGTPPHPPQAVPLFAMGPFLAASLAVTAAALRLADQPGRSGAVLAVLAALMSLVSFGPQKWADPALAAIWPAVLVGQAAALLLLLSAGRQLLAARRRPGLS